jgi:putative transposase
MAIIACCFMPDHVHLVVEGLRDDSDGARFISRAKQLSGYHYNQAFKNRLWQRYSYERVLREEESTRQVVAYVLENPVRAGLAETVHDYPHLRSTVYDRGALIEYAYATESG